MTVLTNHRRSRDHGSSRVNTENQQRRTKELAYTCPYSLAYGLKLQWPGAAILDEGQIQNRDKEVQQ